MGKDNTISSIAITVMPSDNGQFFIITGGLKTNDKVVLEGLIGLKDSTRIIQVPANPDSVYLNLK